MTKEIWKLTGGPRLGVNLDHVATIRQARRTIEPDPVWAGVFAELAGADVITIHLREDRRHIQDRDVRILRETVQVPLNLEMAIDAKIAEIAVEIAPQQVTLVPEKRAEVTTEGGLDVLGNLEAVRACCDQLSQAGIQVSLFIDPNERQIEAAHMLGVPAIELHTGRYADAPNAQQQLEELEAVQQAAQFAHERNLHVHVGHGLTYRNVHPIAAIPVVEELNIGHSLVARAVLVGMKQAVAEMKALILAASKP